MADAGDRPAARRPAGFGDATDHEVVDRSWMIDTILGVYRRYGFQPLETPAIEYLDALGKFLPDKEQPDEGVFALRDDDEQWLALRYDLTAPLARFVAEQGTKLPSPYRRSAVGPVWRREKPGPGRFRQFYQCDFDTVGSSSMAVDAEVCAVLAEAFEALGIARGGYVVRVNNRKVLNGVLSTAGVTDELVEVGHRGRRVAEPSPGGPEREWVAPFQRHTKVLQSIDKLDRVGLDGVRDLLGEGRLDPSGDHATGAFLDPDQIELVLRFVGAGGGSRSDVLERLAPLVGHDPVGLAGIEELRSIDALLSTLGIGEDRVTFDPTVVRGLDYYTGPVYEAVLTFDDDADGAAGSQRFLSVAGGGRYDDLVKRFTGEDVPAAGASIGVDRLLAALRSLGTLDARTADGPVVVTVMDRDRFDDYQAMVADLRGAGIASELYLGEKGFRAQLKYADKRRSPVAVIAGSDEFAAGTVQLKDLTRGKEFAASVSDRQEWLAAGEDVQRSVPRDELVRAVQEIVDRHRAH